MQYQKHRMAGLVCAALVLTAPVMGSAQQSAAPVPASGQTVRATSQLVLVPTSVLDKGKPVRGLKAENFIVEEDGKARPVQVFEAVDTQVKRVHKAATPGEFSNLDSDNIPRSMVLIVVDAVNTPFGYQEASRKEVIKFLSRNVVPNQLIGMVVMSSKGVRIIQDFTGDTNLLLTALQKVSGENNRYNAVQEVGADPRSQQPMNNRGEPAVTSMDAGFPAPTSPSLASDTPAPPDSGQQMLNFVTRSLQLYLKGEDAANEFVLQRRIELTLQMFQQIAQGLAGYPGRKAMIWASASFPNPMDPTRMRDSYLSDLYERTLKVLADANVIVYPVDVKGLQIGNPGADASYTNYDRAAGVDPSGNYRENGYKIDTFRTFAESTGGRAYFDINDNAKAFQDAAEESQSYYMLGYYVSQSTPKGWHKLKVKLKDADGKVHARNGYYYTPAAYDPEASRKADLQLGARSPFDYTSLPLTGRWTEVSAEGAKRRVNFELRVLPQGNILPADSSALNLDIIAVARKLDTTVAAQSGRTITNQLKPEAVAMIRSQGITYHNWLDLEPGEYRVRFLVRENQTGRMGSVEAPLTVK